jgi:hypothetical protein
MRNHKFPSCLAGLLIVLSMGSFAALADGEITCARPDVNKVKGDDTTASSCWLAAAANMLAAAGYGFSTTGIGQDRADNIYDEMVAHYKQVPENNGCVPSGWVDAALEWWLNEHSSDVGSYGVVRAYGDKVSRLPWSRVNAQAFLAGELNASDYAAISAIPPTRGPSIGYGSHVVTVWAECGNPSVPELQVSDSDRSIPPGTPSVEPYESDFPTSPNPGGPNEGPGWYFNYDDPNHWYVWCVYMLVRGGCTGDVITVQVFDSPSTQGTSDLPGGSSYAAAPAFPMPTSPWADISSTPFSTRFAATRTGQETTAGCPFDESVLPEIHWDVLTPEVAGFEEASLIPNVTGGYVVGAFDICDPSQPAGKRLVAEQRFIKRYSYNQSPEEHIFSLAGVSPEGTSYVATNFRFGHSYGYLDRDELWAFDDWMTQHDGPCRIRSVPFRIQIHWPGRLPYPQAQPFEGEGSPNVAGARLFGDEHQAVGFFDNATGATAGGLCVVFDRQVTICNVVGFGGDLTLTGDRSGYVFVLTGNVPPQGTIEVDWQPGGAAPIGSMWLDRDSASPDLSGNRLQQLLQEVLGGGPLPPIW